jgi:hypothetical protein
MTNTPPLDGARILTARPAPGTFLPDLTLWHKWHSSRGTLPARWKGMDLAGVCASLGVPVWRPRAPWKAVMPGVEAASVESETERVTTWNVRGTTLTSRWTRGPDGDWWQAEYPVKSAQELPPALEIVKARTYIVEPAVAGSSAQAVVELPLRPFSEVLHAFIGWTDGLMLLFEAPEAIAEMTAVLESKYQDLARQLAARGPAIMFSPDNLDGQFMSPPLFEEHMKESYRATAETAHEHGVKLAVHVGGPVRALLPGLASAGVDAVEGICGAPQSDAGFAEARALCGPRVTLWGGISQDALLSATGDQAFRDEVDRALADAEADGNAVVGVADRVPVEAVPERLDLLARRARGGPGAGTWKARNRR